MMNFDIFPRYPSGFKEVFCTFAIDICDLRYLHLKKFLWVFYRMQSKFHYYTASSQFTLITSSPTHPQSTLGFADTFYVYRSWGVYMSKRFLTRQKLDDYFLINQFIVVLPRSSPSLLLAWFLSALFRWVAEHFVHQLLIVYFAKRFIGSHLLTTPRHISFIVGDPR